MSPVLERTGDFATFLAKNWHDEAFDDLRRAEIIGRLVGSEAFLKNLERQPGGR